MVGLGRCGRFFLEGSKLLHCVCFGGHGDSQNSESNISRFLQK